MFYASKTVVYYGDIEQNVDDVKAESRVGTAECCHQRKKYGSNIKVVYIYFRFYTYNHL